MMEPLERSKARELLRQLAITMEGFTPEWTPERLAQAYQNGMLPIDSLESGGYYYGYCRNADVAVWTGDNFIYMRHKWGEKFPEAIGHPIDDHVGSYRVDVFVPVARVEPFPEELVPEEKWKR